MNKMVHSASFPVSSNYCSCLRDAFNWLGRLISYYCPSSLARAANWVGGKFQGLWERVSRCYIDAINKISTLPSAAKPLKERMTVGDSVTELPAMNEADEQFVYLTKLNE